MRLAATLALAAFASAPAAAQLDRASFIGLASRVLKVEAVDAAGRVQLGSGVLVAPERVVTSCHVVRRAERVVVLKGGLRREAAAQASDTPHDLCVLHAPGLAGVPVPLGASDALAVGAPLVAVGYTGGAELRFSEGAVVALHPMDGARVIRSSNGFSSGASGGGLFDAAGRLVGILTFRLRGGAAHYFSAPVDWLRGRLDGDAGFAAIAPLAGAAFWELPAERQPYFLQAASLEQASAWDRLRELAERWSRDAPRDAGAACTLGTAQQALGRRDAAMRALQHCVELDPRDPLGWQRLARVYRELGRPLEMHHAVDRLKLLDTPVARALARELDNP